MEVIEGLPLELLLALEHRMVSSDARVLLEAGPGLERLPVPKGLFAEGKLSWGQVRGIVARVRRMPVVDVADVDGRVEASLNRIDKYSPDDLVWAVERAADDIDGARKVERREQRTVQASFWPSSPRFTGSVRLYGGTGPLAGATCLNALDAAGGPPRPEEPGEPGQASSRAKQRAQGLVCICRTGWVGEEADAARPTPARRPCRCGQRHTYRGGSGVGLPRATTDVDRCHRRDPDTRCGPASCSPGRVLCGVGQDQGERDPRRICLAVRARDRGCRFPGSTGPASRADVHHLREQAGRRRP